jgi:hypothetical protein
VTGPRFVLLSGGSAWHLLSGRWRTSMRSQVRLTICGREVHPARADIADHIPDGGHLCGTCRAGTSETAR